MEDKNRPLDREPDVVTPAFKIWRRIEGDPDFSPLVKIDGAAGEEIHESRLYLATAVPGYELLVMAKKKEEKYWFAVKGKRPNGSTFIKTGLQGPMSLDEYHGWITKLERNFSFLFDTTNPQVTPGRHYMVYMKPKKET